MINVQHLDFYYGNTQALYDVSVELPQGSITGLIGPNGAGKSTLMRCMAGLEIPTSGDVLLDGLPILDNPRDSFSKLGYLPDFFGLPDGLSVIQCLTYAAKSRGIPDARLPDLLLETVRLLNLEHKLYAKVSDLSRGQKQRVAIARALVNNPSIILADEPTGALDTKTGEQIMELLTELNREGKTIIMVTHEPEIADYATRKIVIRDGEITADTTESVRID